jgi:TRAP-type C4-dicarboxylate transport system substrate-binding protein
MKITKTRMKQIIKEEVESSELISETKWFDILNAEEKEQMKQHVDGAMASDSESTEQREERLKDLIKKFDAELEAFVQQDSDSLEEKIKPVGDGKYKATTDTGKELSKSPKTKEDALKQLAAVKISQ